MTLRIKTISQLTGIREATLRAWERRYGFPQPHRASNNYRTYSRDDVEVIRRVSRLLEQGYTASEAIEQVRQVPTETLPTRQRLEERFWSAVMIMDADEVRRTLDESVLGLPPLVATDEVFVPLLRKMSMRLDVAREHLASAAIRQKLRELLNDVTVSVDGPSIVLACPPKDQHEGGLLAIALHLRTSGWRTIVVGADTPAEALRSAVASARAAMVALSFVRPYDDGEFEIVLSELVRCVSVPVVVGGPATHGRMHEVYRCGAYFATCAEDVIALHRRFALSFAPGR